MADSNYAAIGVIKEAQWGVTPAAPALKTMRLTSETLDRPKETVESQEVRSDRQIADLVEVGSSANGGINFELSYGALKPFLISALFGVPTVIALAGITSDITAVSDTIEGAANDFDSVPIGSTVKITGATTPENNGLKLVIDKSADGSLLTFGAGSFGTDELAVDLDLSGINVKNGTNRESYSMERRVITTNGSDFYQSYYGMTVDTLALSFESKTIITGSLTFVGKNGGADVNSIDPSVDGATSYAAAEVDPVMDATNNFSDFLFQQVTSSECLKTLALNLANGLRGKDCIGQNGNFDVGVGTCQVTGSFSGYFLNNDLYNLILNHGNVALSWKVEDATGNVIVFTLPRIKVSGPPPQIGGRNTDMMPQASYTAIADPLTGATMIVDFHPAA